MDLLPDLAGLILRLLPCHLDRLRFRFTGNDERFQGNRVYVLGYSNFFGYFCDAMPSYGFYDLSTGTIGQVLHDRVRVAAWPVSRMPWFFPLE
ncbi:hypothetical protein C2845_PM18G00900 [Panicum miliaceum]|uniref:Uncharacterized protein n=1 Tax=Panicum miliaceum TaxID=4540 RepID=A0A3L6PNE9_PANMI|nr:hypothetical protein C2845_PM18G00900 [Panicum miliaceum]